MTPKDHPASKRQNQDGLQLSLATKPMSFHHLWFLNVVKASGSCSPELTWSQDISTGLEISVWYQKIVESHIQLWSLLAKTQTMPRKEQRK